MLGSLTLSFLVEGTDVYPSDVEISPVRLLAGQTESDVTIKCLADGKSENVEFLEVRLQAENQETESRLSSGSLAESPLNFVIPAHGGTAFCH